MTVRDEEMYQNKKGLLTDFNRTNKHITDGGGFFLYSRYLCPTWTQNK